MSDLDRIPWVVDSRATANKSRSDADFGRRYLDLQVEATLVRRSGRAESGYFAPLSD